MASRAPPARCPPPWRRRAVCRPRSRRHHWLPAHAHRTRLPHRRPAPLLSSRAGARRAATAHTFSRPSPPAPARPPWRPAPSSSWRRPRRKQHASRACWSRVRERWQKPWRARWRAQRSCRPHWRRPRAGARRQKRRRRTLRQRGRRASRGWSRRRSRWSASGASLPCWPTPEGRRSRTATTCRQVGRGARAGVAWGGWRVGTAPWYGSMTALLACAAASRALITPPWDATLPQPQVELQKVRRERDDAHRAASNLKQALVQQRAAAELDRAAARAAGEAEAAARWQGRVSDLRKQVGAAGWGGAGAADCGLLSWPARWQQAAWGACTALQRHHRPLTGP